MCGTRLALVCQTCGHANPLGYRFCFMCGTQLVDAPLPAQLPLPLWESPPAPVLPAVQRESGTLPPIKTAPPEPVHPQKLEGERRVATVILADVTNSTVLLEQVGSEAWVEIMNRIFQILEAEIYRFGGQVDQFRGDGLVAFFGATTAHEDDPERAVLAALSMQKEIHRYAAELFQRENIELKLRVGINTGELIVASVGDSNQYREDTAMGEAVTIAARMESAAEPGTVLVSENTYRLVETRFQWQPLGDTTLKGVSQPIRVYRPLDLEPDIERAHELRMSEFLTPVSGRETEVQTLKNNIADLFGGRGGVAILTGEKGMGKSFVLNQLRQHLARVGALRAEVYSGDRSADRSDQDEHSPPNVTWLRGICRSYDQSWVFSIWLDMLQRWLGVRPGEPSEETRNRLRQQSEVLWGDRMDRYYPYLATFLSLPLEDTFAERVRYLDAQGLQGQFFVSVRSWVEALAKRGPLVLAFSDLHWADTASLELLKYCLPLCDSETLFWLLVFRPERASPVWEFRHYVETEYPHRLTQVELAPLTAAECQELIDQLIGPAALSEKTRELVISKAEGNPYFVREMIHALINEGVLVQEAETGAWRETRAVTSLDLPESLQSLLLSKIDHLSTEERRILQMAAVIGQVFWRNVLEALASDNNQLQHHLTTLQRAQLIQERSQVPVLGMEYVFSSSLVRDVAYESLLSPQRINYHLKAAQYLEDCVGLEGRIRHDSLIAYHYRQAGLHDKELYYTQKAAEQASRVYANPEACEHYTRAIELLDEMKSNARNENQVYAICAQQFEMFNRRSEIFYLLGRIPEGDADARALLELARQVLEDRALLVDALLAQPEARSPETHEQLEQGMQMAHEALDLAQGMGDRRREMFSLITLAGLLLIQRDPGLYEVGERALSLARELGDQETLVRLLLGAGSAYGMDNLERGVQYLEEALNLVQEIDDKRTEMQLLSVIGPKFERSGDYYRFLEEYTRKVLAISQEIGDRLSEGNALMFCAQIQGLYLGDYEGGLALLEESLRVWEGTNQMLFPLLRVAQTQVEQGNYAQAAASLERARPLGERNVYDLGRAGLDLVAAILYNRLGDEASLRMALELTSRTHRMVAENQVSQQYQLAAACEASAAHLGLAICLAGSTASQEECQEHFTQSLALAKTALDIYNRFGFVQVVECVSEEVFFRYSRALEANGREPEANEYLQLAYDEMMRKHALIPAASPFSQTYLKNIRLHREIQAAYRGKIALDLQQEVL